MREPIAFGALLCCLMTVFSNAGAGAADANSKGYELLRLSGHYVKWGEARMGAGASITYAFIGRHREFAGTNCTSMDPLAPALAKSTISEPALRNEAAKAFALWSAVANITFEEAEDSEAANILIGAESHPIGWAFTNVEQEDPKLAIGQVVARGMGLSDVGQTTMKPPHISAGADSPAPIRQSLICLNTSKQWKTRFDGNLAVYDLELTLAHEIGHSIGLDHPGPTGALMGYRYTEQIKGLAAGDIAGVVALYGPRRF